MHGRHLSPPGSRQARLVHHVITSLTCDSGSQSLCRVIRSGMLRLLGNLRSCYRWRPDTALLTRHYKIEPVGRDVVLFEHRRPRFFRLLGMFCVAQTGFWAYSAHFGFTTLRDIRPSNKGEDGEVKGRNMGSPLWRTLFTLGCLSVGRSFYLLL